MKAGNAFITAICSIGVTYGMDEYEKRKLCIFNQLNFFQLVTGTVVPIAGLFYFSKFPPWAWLAACLPPLISGLVIVLNGRQKYRTALFCYFIFYPVFTCFIYLNGMNTGSELSFILYGILSVFFLQETGYMIFALVLSLISYFILFVVSRNQVYQPEPITTFIYQLNQLVIISYIFLAIFLVKRESTGYQLAILRRNSELVEKNQLIAKQHEEISGKAVGLEQQAELLQESNHVKTKLFSMISHDLKAPVFGLRNLFRHLKENDLSAENIKSMIPDIVNDLNNSAVLIENLLQWSKCQMQEFSIRRQVLDITKLLDEVTKGVSVQAGAKSITIVNESQSPIAVSVDKDMISMVIRNLLSNAIKFSPVNSKIIIGAFESPVCVEVYVKDFGQGLSREQLTKINSNTFYTTKGTNNEQGSGLGLMLCREFIHKNEGCLMIESEVGQGSTFSFTLPRPSDY